MYFINLRAICLSAVLAISFLMPSQSHAETEDTYKSVSPSVLQVLILDRTSGAKSSFGSGFFAGDEAYVVTNFHVISDLVFHPEKFHAEYRTHNDERGLLKLLYFDVVNDLAVMKSDGYRAPALKILSGSPPKGARIYAMGHPHDLGLSVVEGTYNGLLEDKIIPRIHYTGSLNPGMSGGPALDADDNLVGVNVAAMGDQVSFLVPARYVTRMLADVKKGRDADFKQLVSKQLLDHQQRYMDPILSRPFRELSFGLYQVPGELSVAFECWGSSKESGDNLYSANSHKCETDDYVYLSADDYTGTVEYRHEFFETEALGAQRFYGFLERHLMTIHVSTAAEEKNVTSFVCNQGLVDNNDVDMKLISCFRGHKVIDGLYDSFLLLTTVEDDDRALYSVAMVSGVSYENGLAFQRRYMESIARLKEAAE